MFRKLSLLPSSVKVCSLLCWVPVTELISIPITGPHRLHRIAFIILPWWWQQSQLKKYCVFNEERDDGNVQRRDDKTNRDTHTFIKVLAYLFLIIHYIFRLQTVIRWLTEISETYILTVSIFLLKCRELSKYTENCNELGRFLLNFTNIWV
jgi:hypothetical protein